MNCTWSYGVMTVPERTGNVFPKTLDSLALAGFDKPRIFLDGSLELVSLCAPEAIDLLSRYPLTIRDPRIRTFCNWMLGVWELFLREPNADRYAMFQDDVMVYRNLRAYLDRCEYPELGYWNLYTYSYNAQPIKGWYPTRNQGGKGALGLVFDNLTVRHVIGSEYIIKRFKDEGGWKAVDGAIVSALGLLKCKEYVHNPSLLQHTSDVSSMGNRRQEVADTFKGQEFDALSLL